MSKRVLGHAIKWNCRGGQDCFKDNACPNWAFLEGAFPRNCLPTDLDGFIELGNRFLILEWKMEAASLKRGQQMLFESLTAAGQRNQFIVLVLYGSPRTMEVVYSQVIHNGKVEKAELSSTEGAIDFCNRWAGFAESNGL